MKYILTNTNNEVFGTFNTITKINNGYLCDGAEFQTTVTGVVTLSEVSDDYEIPSQIQGFNDQQSKLRAKAYPIDSDPMFFEWQRGTKTEQEWLDAVNAIKARYPYKDIA
jgi:hypothetical protein